MRVAIINKQLLINSAPIVCIIISCLWSEVGWMVFVRAFVSTSIYLSSLLMITGFREKQASVRQCGASPGELQGISLETVGLAVCHSY